MFADLHCHTMRSDGSALPEEAVRMAASRDIPVLAITDHDCIGDLSEVESLGNSLGVRVVPGLELSTFDPKTGRKTHILVYGVKHPQPLKALCDQTCRSRQKAGEEMLEIVQQYYPIPQELVLRWSQYSPAFFKQHIMLALMNAGYTNQMFGELFQKLFNAKTGLAYRSVTYPNVHEALEVVRQAGGVSVLAHPSEYKSQELLQELASAGEIDGVEVWHPRNPQEELPFFMEIAERFHLLMTGGTDFHGSNRKNPLPLGSCTAPKEQWERLAERL